MLWCALTHRATTVLAVLAVVILSLFDIPESPEHWDLVVKPHLVLDLETIHAQGTFSAIIERFVIANVGDQQAFIRKLDHDIGLALPIWEQEPHLCNNFRVVLDKNGNLYPLAPASMSSSNLLNVSNQANVCADALRTTLEITREIVLRGPILQLGSLEKAKEEMKKLVTTRVGDHLTFMETAMSEFALAIDVLKNEPYHCQSNFRVQLDSQGKLHSGTKESLLYSNQHPNIMKARRCIDFMNAARNFIRHTISNWITDRAGLGPLSELLENKESFYPNNDRMYKKLYQRIGCQRLTEEQKESAACGATKCWFPDEKDSSIGYLISHETEEQRWLEFVNGWINVQILKHKYNITHSQLESPHRIMIPKETDIDLLGCLRFLATPQEGTEEHFSRNSNIPLIVQANRAFPWPVIELRATYDLNAVGRQKKQKLAGAKIENLLRKRARLNRRATTATASPTEFLLNMEREMTLAIMILEKESYLCSDFQVMMDHRGLFHYFDLRGLLAKPRDPQPCIDFLNGVRQTIRNKMGKPSHTATVETLIADSPKISERT